MISTHVVDIIILVIFLFSMIIGFSRGFINEVVSLLTLIAAFVIATLFANPVAELFTHSSMVAGAVQSSASATGIDAAKPVSYVALGLSFGFLFIVTLIVGTVIKSILNIAFLAGMLSLGNRLLGMAFGLLRGFLLNILLIFMIQLTPISAHAQWQASQYVPLFQPYVTWLSGIVSPALANLKDRYGDTVNNVTSGVKDAAMNLSR